MDCPIYMLNAVLTIISVQLSQECDGLNVLGFKNIYPIFYRLLFDCLQLHSNDQLIFSI